MAIHPQYANAILDGTKRVEFRKRRLAADIGTVLIYATSPVQRIIGHFTIEKTVTAAPDKLWRDFSDVGGIDEDAFLRYFGDSQLGFGFIVKAAYRLPEQLTLDHIEPRTVAPQSFRYLHVGALRCLLGGGGNVHTDTAPGSSAGSEGPERPVLTPRLSLIDEAAT